MKFLQGIHPAKPLRYLKWFDIFLAFAGIILIGTVFAYTAFLKGASMVGPVKSSLLASIEPISAVFFAFMIMGDIFYPVDFLGMAMILLAVTIISLKDLMLEKRKKSELKLRSLVKK